ncbi:MAG TPA: hypothetical protein DHW82_14170 [Spirochaetia bacterium]|nr:hypothetical protein [Spirochaetia bacterium]
MMRSLGNYYLMDQVKTISKKHKLDPLLVTSVILSESSAYSFAVSYMNAKGLMQLMPETALAVAKGMKNGMYDKIKENPGLIYDPSINIELAVIHLKGMYQFVAKKQWDSALHIYNLSSYAFKKGQRNHSYVDGILKRVKKWKG